MRRLAPHQIEPSSTDGQVMTTVAGKAAWAAPPGGGGGSVTYGQTNKTFTIARNATGGTNWNYLSWIVSHYAYMRILSFDCEMFQSDTYTLSIDGFDVASAATTGGAAPYALALPLGTPRVLTPGPHIFRLRGTTSHRFYYNNSNGAVPTGTYTSGIVFGNWIEASSTTTTPHGTLTFDAEGV